MIIVALLCFLAIGLVVSYWRVILITVMVVLATFLGLCAIVAFVRHRSRRRSTDSASRQRPSKRQTQPSARSTALRSESRSLTIHGPIDSVWAAASDLDGIVPLIPGVRFDNHDGDVVCGDFERRSASRNWQFRGEVRVVERSDEHKRVRTIANAESSDPAVVCQVELTLEVGSQSPQRTVCLLRANATTTGHVPHGDRADFERLAINALRLVAEGLKQRLAIDGLSPVKPAAATKRQPVARSEAAVPTEPANRGILPPQGQAPRSTRNLRAAWDYQPRAGVFVVNIFDDAPARILLEEFYSISDAVARWAEIALPIQTGWGAEVIDSNLAVVLGYSTILPHHVQFDFPDGIWTGCEAGFAALRDLNTANVVDLAIWESLAQRLE